MKKKFFIAFILIGILGVLWVSKSQGQAPDKSQSSSVPVTVSVYATSKEVVEPCHLKCLLTWGPKPKGSMKVEPIPAATPDSSATTILMVPSGHKELITFKESWSSNCEVSGTCLKGVLSVGQASQNDASSSGTCAKGSSINQLSVVAGGTATLLK